MGNDFTPTAVARGVDEPDPDTAMVAAGVVISLLVATELYPLWKATGEE